VIRGKFVPNWVIFGPIAVNISPMLLTDSPEVP